MAAIERMESELSKLERKRDRLFDDYEDGTYSKNEFIERKQKYNSDIEALKKQIQEFKSEIPEPVNYEEQIVNIHTIIECLNNPNMDAKAKNDLLKDYIEDIKYDVIDYGRNKGGKPVLDVYLK